MTYELTADIIHGAKLVAALQNHPMMPSVADMHVELDYIAQLILETEQFYGVPFTRPERGQPYTEFKAIEDVSAHIKEFYFGGSQTQIFGYRIVAFHRLIIEPLFESMASLSHDEVLDSAANVIDQIKELITIADATGTIDSETSYVEYRKMFESRQADRRVKTITKGIMEYRAKLAQ